MIPLRDRNPRSSVPWVTALLVLINILAFLYQVSLGPQVGERFVLAYGMVPARVEWALSDPDVTLGAAVFPLLTSIFLHGGWLHLIGNMWFLWVFGDNVEDRLGHLRYLVFYLACGLGAGLVHVLFNLDSRIPAVGASGAISGILGAYMVLFPGARVLTLIPLLVFFFTVELPAVILLGYWFLIQTLSGLGALGMRGRGGVAWWAHVGGFLLGLLLAKWAAQGRPRPSLR